MLLFKKGSGKEEKESGIYWSNPSRTGCSDLQPANPYGYVMTLYPIATGANDIAPLLSQEESRLSYRL